MNIEVLDETALKQLLDDVEPAAQELIDLFVSDIRDRMGQLSGISDETDITAVTIHAHSLKGLIRTCGMVNLSDIAYDLEQACRAGNREQAIEHFAVISKHIEPVIKILMSFVEKQTPSQES